MQERRVYFREWRKKHHLTQAQVVARLSSFDDDKLPTTEASLSRLETGKQQYTERVLLALADIYKCEPHELIGRNPLVGGAVIDMVAKLDARRQAQVAAFIAATEEAEKVEDHLAVAEPAMSFRGQTDSFTPVPTTPVRRRKR